VRRRDCLTNYLDRLTKANTSIRSDSKSFRLRPGMNLLAVAAASIMCRMRVRSSGGKLHLRRALYFFPEVRTELLCGAQIDTPPAHQLGKLSLDRSESEQSRRRSGLELHDEIDIAVWPLGGL
jgi:hypothetical protein